MARRPEPVQDLNWSPDRARDLGSAMVKLWGELMERLPELPVNRETLLAVAREHGERLAA